VLSARLTIVVHLFLSRAPVGGLPWNETRISIILCIGVILHLCLLDIRESGKRYFIPSGCEYHIVA
jgi:hypothetical protein